jgi:hypothetical protein
VVAVEQDRERQAAPIDRDQAQRLRAAEMRDEQQASWFARDDGADVIRAFDVDRECLVAIGQQENAIERATRKPEEVSPQVAPPWISPEHAPQVVARGIARGRTGEQEVGDDGIEQWTHHRAPQRRGHPHDQAHHRWRAAFLVAAPVVHGVARADTMNEPSKTETRGTRALEVDARLRRLRWR